MGGAEAPQLLSIVSGEPIRPPRNAASTSGSPRFHLLYSSRMVPGAGRCRCRRRNGNANWKKVAPSARARFLVGPGAHEEVTPCSVDLVISELLRRFVITL
jgi:hypothetical protein